MDYNDFRSQDMALKEQISNYRIRNCEMMQEISANECEIAKLEWKRTELHNKFNNELSEEQ